MRLFPFRKGEKMLELLSGENVVDTSLTVKDVNGTKVHFSQGQLISIWEEVEVVHVATGTVDCVLTLEEFEKLEKAIRH